MKVTVNELKNNSSFNEKDCLELFGIIQSLSETPDEKSLDLVAYEYVERHMDNADENTILKFAKDNTDYLERVINEDFYTFPFFGNYSFFEHCKEAFRIRLEEQYNDLLEKYGEIILEIVVIDMLDKKHIEIDSDSAEYGIIQHCISNYIRDTQDGCCITFTEFYKDLIDDIKE